MLGRKPDGTICGFARGDTLSGQFDAMVERVSNDVYERVVEPLDDRLVKLGVSADSDKVDVLAQLRGKVPDDSPELVESGTDRQHPHAHRIVAKLLHEPVELL